MRGHDQLLAMRRANRRPAAVWITDSDDEYSRVTARDWANEPNRTDGRVHAHIRIEATDIPEALDLRCLVGLEVHVSSDRGAARHHRIFDSVLDAGAAAVIAVIGDEAQMQYRQPEAMYG